MKRRVVLVVCALAVVAGAFAFTRPRATTLVLTGVVTTDDVVVAPQVAGRLGKLLVREGDAVACGQLLAVIEPAELEADRAFYAHTADANASEVEQSAAALRYEERGTANQIKQAEASLAAVEAQGVEAAASLEDARLTFERQVALASGGSTSEQDRDHARAAFEVAKARFAALGQQAEAQRAAVALARASAEQVALRRSALVATRAHRAAAEAQRAKADVRLGYAEVRAPITGVVDVRAARLGEVVGAGQPIVTLVDPDDLWVRADVEETYVDRCRLGDELVVRLPSGEERKGKIFFRGVDAGFATQRDVSRTKRDIRTFELRLRVDNRDRRLATGMTAYVRLPVVR
jgi:multidrug resistance efflux pump